MIVPIAYFTQVTPGHVNELLAMNTEEVEPENPKLKLISVFMYVLCIYCTDLMNY